MIGARPPGVRRAATVAVMVGRSPAERYSVHRGYVDAVTALEAQPILVPVGPSCDPDRILDLVGSCDALILTGGNDVDPRLYGQMPGRGKEDPDPERDHVEVSAVRASVSAGRPVLGICRGIQLLAAADGGSLIADLPSAGYDFHCDEGREFEPVHEISADPGSIAHHNPGRGRPGQLGISTRPSRPSAAPCEPAHGAPTGSSRPSRPRAFWGCNGTRSG